MDLTFIFFQNAVGYICVVFFRIAMVRAAADVLAIDYADTRELFEDWLLPIDD